MKKRVLVPAFLLALSALAWAVAQAVAAPSLAASFTADPASPLIGQAVTFTSTSTATADRPIGRYTWDLDGNGTFETGTAATPSASRTYTKAGVVVVALKVFDSRGKTSRASRPVTVRASDATPPPPPPPADDKQPPNASFIYSPDEPRPGQVITFASTSSDPGPTGAIAQESWDLGGDGVFGDAVGRTAAAAFPAGGHAVSLRVTDRAGNQSVYTQSIDVQPDPAAVAGTLQLPSSSRSLRLMRPFPVIRMAGRYTERGVRVHLFTVKAASSATLIARCSGRGCPFRRIAPRPKGQATASRRLRLRAVERWLPSGVRLVVTITRPGEIGKYTRFKIRRLKPPARVDRCMRPDSPRPVRCPTPSA